MLDGLLSLYGDGRAKFEEGAQAVVEEISNKAWQAEARTEETRQFIRDVRRIQRRRFTPEQTFRIVLEGFQRETPIRYLRRRREGIRPGT